MGPEVATQSATLYDTDYQLWLAQTIAQLQAHDFAHLDLENLIEEIASLGKSDKRSLTSYLMRLCEHLLKVKYWESERVGCFRGWVLEINHFRTEIDLILQDSPSLKPFVHELFPLSYRRARKNLLNVMPLPTGGMPEDPDFTLEKALDDGWLPWRPESQSESCLTPPHSSR